MGIRIIESRDGKMAALYCSTTDWAFGPVFSDYDESEAGERALAFLRWLPLDARKYIDSDLERKYSEWLVSLEKEPKT